MLRRELIAGALLALRRNELQPADALLRKVTDSGEVTGAVILVRQGKFESLQAFGKTTVETPYLLASLSKPMTARGILVLRDRKELALDDAVQKFLPAFRGGDRGLVTMRHLLTHTSGLPDMLPDNDELRARHAPLSDFVKEIFTTPLLFKPGTEVRYQSMGILLASAVAEKITQTPFPEFLKREVFEPLRLRATSLGLGGRPLSQMAQVQVPKVSDWDWNSEYWRNLASPWGGAHAPAADVGTFFAAFQQSATGREMITNQTAGMKQNWGLGVRLNPGAFGRSCSAETYGHYGSTGTAAWSDPKTGTTYVLLTTKPAAADKKNLLGPVSDMVSDATKA